MNGKIRTEDLLAYRLGLLSEEERNVLETAIRNSPDLAAADRAVRDGLSGGGIRIPEELASRADTAWTQGTAAPSFVPFQARTRKPLRYSLAAAAVLLLTAGVILFLGPKSGKMETAVASRQGEITATPGRTIKPGFSLTAGITGRARISLPKSGTIAFRGPGRLTLASADNRTGKPAQRWRLDGGSARINLRSGTWNRFTISTPHLRIQVTGTRFFVSVSDKRTTVQVEEGRVSVHEADKPARMIDAGRHYESAPPKPAVKKKAPAPRQTTLSERIILKNGSVITGRILAQTKDILTIRTTAGILRVPRKDVQAVRINKQ